MALSLVLAACGPSASPDPRAQDSAAELDEREAARQDAQRIMRDVELETLAKRVAALETEIEQLKAQQAGASALEFERRLTQLEVAPEAVRPAAAPVTPASPKAPTKGDAPARADAAKKPAAATRTKAPAKAAKPEAPARTARPAEGAPAKQPSAAD